MSTGDDMSTQLERALELLREARDWVQQQTNFALGVTEALTPHPLAVRIDTFLSSASANMPIYKLVPIEPTPQMIDMALEVAGAGAQFWLSHHALATSELPIRGVVAALIKAAIQGAPPAAP